MTKRPYQKQTYHLTGKILHKNQKKIYTGEFQGSSYYKLEILTKKQNRELIYVFANLVPSPVWQAIQQEHYFNKWYCLAVEKGRNNDFRLKDWAEVKHG